MKKIEEIPYSHISAYYCKLHGTKQVTFRKNGKAHRGLIMEGSLFASCKCPGSRNGSLTRGASILADGWEISNCEH